MTKLIITNPKLPNTKRVVEVKNYDVYQVLHILKFWTSKLYRVRIQRDG